MPSSFRMVAQTLHGLEEVLRVELLKLGARDLERHNRAVSFTGDLGFLYKANLCLRTAIRVLVPLDAFDARSPEEVYAALREIEWETFMDVQDTFLFKVTLNSTYFTHSQYVAQKAKDAVADRFREKKGVRPSVDTENPTLRIHLHINNERCTLSLDSSGGSLHQRGYRTETNAAPLNEVLAAGMVILSGWNKLSPLVDPFCGSGTILIEAAMLAANIPPGIYREKFAFEGWNDFDPDLWDTIRNSAIDKITGERPIILGGDIDRITVSKAKETLRNAKLDDGVTIRHCAFADLEAPDRKGMLILNPPYGERMNERGIAAASAEEDINALYKMIGDTLKHRWAGWTAWVLTSNLDAAKHIKLTPKPKIQLFNGALDCRFLRYELYEGSRRLSPLPTKNE
ncbi:MAG: class I SAM-dependent RNA methyltransferase [Flavobacteriales bacterium]|nr:class I SAM-dependent RNA methyltransferase [Flavobacteriales bacterium]MBP8878228.1 class I SAM-dependent RNA methyltransferase [Flavobacteriales bacterium]